MRSFSTLILIAVVVATSGTLTGQTVAPKCGFIRSAGLESEPRLAEVTSAESADAFSPWKDCSPDRGECEKGLPILTQQPVQVLFVRGDWTCVDVGGQGSGGEWVQSSKLNPMVSDPKPPLVEWVGTWWPLKAKHERGTDRLVIEKTVVTDTLRVHGNAYWYGAIVDGHPVTHFGGVDGESKPQGNYLRIQELDKAGNPDGCKVEMRLIGQYLMVADNSQCGGMNVRFWGLYRK
jgi:hypothetical protein